MSIQYQPSNAESVFARVRARIESAARPPGKRVAYSGAEFEADVSALLGAVLPFSVLPGVRIFDPGRRDTNDFGYEMDALLHIRYEGADWIVIVEAKHQFVKVTDQNWDVFYDGKAKDVRDQIDSHVRTLWSYLEPIAVNRELKFLAVVVSSDSATLERKVAGFRNAEVHLISFTELPTLLAERFNLTCDPARYQPEILRVAQSEYLDLLRFSLPRPELGHPEYTSALRYVERCRRSLDETLFLEFKPTPERWVINGSAGMGKSVLLAYAAVVLSTGYELKMFQGESFPATAAERLAEISFDSTKGSVVIAAMSARQLETLRFWFRYFVEIFQKGDEAGNIRVKPPHFILCRSAGDLTPSAGREWSALLVDEAHDLERWATRELAEQYEKHGFYLVVACDRHQKLRLTSANARIVEGIDFQRKSIRLKQVYRNPAAVYIASLALMFRWFAASGPKVLPTLKELEGQFGFNAISLGKDRALSIRNDVHPANSWSHTIATFPDVTAAFIALRREKLAAAEVLWARFSEEDSDFDYEKLSQHFTYHNCRSEEAHKICDKYIKGQDYPVVVIEGFPGFMDRYGTRAQEAKMWEFRRELYLCASRATCFLYFICNVTESEEIARIKGEISAMMQEVSSPDGSNGGTKTWKFVVKSTDTPRSLDVFIESESATLDENPPEELSPEAVPANSPEIIPIEAARELPEPQSPVVEEIQPETESFTLEVDGSMTIPEFAEAMEVSILDIQSRLLDLNIIVTDDTTLGLSTMKRLAAEWNTTVTLVPPVEEPDFSRPEEESPPPAISGGKTVVKDANERSPSPQKQSDHTEDVAKNIVEISAPIIVKELAAMMGLKPFLLIQNLMEMDVFANLTQAIDVKYAREVCKRHGFSLRVIENAPNQETENA